MNVLILKGGLGNQFFEIAACFKYLRHKSQSRLAIYSGNLNDYDTPRDLMIKPFLNSHNFEITYLENKKYILNRFILHVLNVLNLSINDDNYMLKYKKGKFLIRIFDGYFQKHEFLDYLDFNYFRESLELYMTGNKFSKLIKNIEKEKGTVGIHVRGTDRKGEYDLIKIDQKIKLLIDGSKFKKVYCFTDDIQFTEELLGKYNVEKFNIINFGMSDIEEFYLISRMQCFILINGNSSYSVVARIFSETNTISTILRNKQNEFENELVNILQMSKTAVIEI